MPKVAVIIVSYNHARFLRSCLASLARVIYPRDAWKIFLVDNASTDGTVTLVRETLIDETIGTTRVGNIKAVFLSMTTNTGFTGGNNHAMKIAQDEGFDYVYLLNPDTEVDPNFIDRAVTVAAFDSKIAGVQSLLLLAHDKSKINSWGNEIHFLGFSFCGGYRELRNGENARARLTVRDIPAASGAAVLYRLSALHELDYFDDAIFAYHEDVDMAWRLRLRGHRVVLAPQSVVYHRYEFSRSIKKFYFMERNRWWVHSKNLKIGTLIVIAPAFLFMEIGLWLFAFTGGWWREKARAYGYYFSWSHLGALARARREIQRTRMVPDKEIVQSFSPRILYQEIAHPLWEYVGNPFFAAYWWIVKRLIVW